MFICLVYSCPWNRLVARDIQCVCTKHAPDHVVYMALATLIFTMHRGNNIYIPRKYCEELHLGMVFMSQELGMPTQSLLKRFEPFNLHNQCNLDFAVEQTCAEISYYPQFCG